jgi:hypothetical protein
MIETTLVITSCGRLDLLEITLKSFFRFNSSPVKKTLIIDDSGKNLNFNKIESCISSPYEIIKNERNLGQMRSIDKVYSKVNTEYIFHCEDDWEFLQSGFIEKSFEILNVDNKIFTVWLRSYNEKKIKKAIDFSSKHGLGKTDFFYRIIKHSGKSWQNGFTLNPGLRRTADCMLRHPYADLPVLFPKENVSVVGERDLAVHYGELGFGSAITSKENGYIRHIGGKRHILLPWEI